jgi:pimeloyl-ACP methyl ester carboxylesterase
MDLVQLSAGQQLLLAMPDEPLAPESAPNEELFRASLAATFAPSTQPAPEELAAQWRLLEREGGNRILPRLIRYVEERRAHEPRWTGAIERHPAPVTIVWGDADPIAVFAMAQRLAEQRPDAKLERLEGIGHYLMIEAPERVRAALSAALG